MADDGVDLNLITDDNSDSIYQETESETEIWRDWQEAVLSNAISVSNASFEG